MGMMTSVFFALPGAGIADFGAQYHEIARKFRASRIESAAKGADVGAVAAEFDAVRHVVAFAVAVMHVEASRDAALTGFGAFKARIDVAVVMLHRFHNRCQSLADQRWSDKITMHN